MTVATSERKQSFAGGQSSLEFTFRTLVSNPEYVKVKLVETATGTETDLTYSTQFTVSVNSDGVGGTVTVSPTFSTSYTYLVYRDTSAIQNSDYEDYNQFPADTIEGDLDRAILIAQEQQEATDRTLRYPISASAASTELPSPSANDYIGWNSAGDALENKSLPDPSTLQKASNSDATTATNDTNYMTPAKVKLEVENSGSVAIPVANITGLTTLVKATQAEAEAGVENTAFMTPLRVSQAITALSPGLRVYVGSFTRDMAGTAGDVSYTGSGFTPKVIIAFALVDQTAKACVFGFSSATSGNGIFADSASAGSYQAGGGFIYIEQSGGVYQAASLKTFDSNGFTLTWTKGGSPTAATISCTYLLLG